jgi:hypothetical protein
MNFSKNTQPLENYYDVTIDYSLSQVMHSRPRQPLVIRETPYMISSSSTAPPTILKNHATTRQWSI